MRFDDDTGLFWTPFQYSSTRVKGEKTARAPRVAPPIPDTGWQRPQHFPDLSNAKAIAIDTETCDPELRDKGPGVRRGAYICGVSVATEDFAGYFPIKHSVEPEWNMDPQQVFSWLRRELSRPRQFKVGANILYDLDMLAGAGVKVEGRCLDVLYADALIDENQNRYNLDVVAERRLNLHKETSLLYRWCADAYGGKPNERQRENIWRSPPRLVGPYAEQDAILPLRIMPEQYKLMRHSGVTPIFHMECGLLPLLLEMRQRGVLIDIERTKEVDRELTDLIEAKQEALGINVFASEEIRQYCDKHGIEYPRTAPTKGHPDGQPSFVKKWLMSHEHPALKAVSELRTFYKLRNDFIRGAMLESNIDGRIHCEFHPLRSDGYGTVSGRYSSSHPNLQQIPARDPYWGPRLRSCFIPEDGRVWEKKDLSQIEFRFGAHFGIGTNAAEIRRLYNENPKIDFYNIAVEMTGLLRQDAKSLTLGTMYGMRPAKFARMTDKSFEEAKETFAQFNDRLPFMAETFEHYQALAEEQGWIDTIGGRICHMEPGLEYKTLNRKLQGSCGDWLKRSMLEAYNRGLFAELQLYLTVHDEMDVGLRRRQASVDASRELDEIMRTAYPLSVPVLAGCDVGRSWGELRELDDPSELTLALLKQL